MDINANKKSSGAIDYTGPKGQLNLTADAVAIAGATTITGDLVVSGDFAQGAVETVTDPGDAGTITPPTNGANFSVAIVTAGAETRVMGTPTRLGQRAIIRFLTDGGNFTMANASGWRGFVDSTTVTFDDAGDAIELVAVGTGAATDWRVDASKGVEYSTSAGQDIATVADPGDGQTITPPTDGSDFMSNITTAGASETRVLGTPSRIGQLAIVRHAVDGGDFAMTNASGWKGGGSSDDVATFAEVEDTLVVIAVGVGAVTDWRWIADKAVVFA